MHFGVQMPMETRLKGCPFKAGLHQRRVRAEER
jgi:hypothetical protein